MARAILEETNEFIEKWSKIGLFFFKRMAIPCYILPKVAVSFFIYFTTDAGGDAFHLPFSMWWVFKRWTLDKHNQYLLFRLNFLFISTDHDKNIDFICLNKLRKRVPYDWKNTAGYLVTVVIQYNLLFDPIQFFACSIFLAFGAFIFTNSLVELLKNDARLINKMARHKKTRKNVRKKFFEFVCRHADARQLSEW